MKEIVQKFKLGQCVYLASNPETKMTISDIQTVLEKFNGTYYCVWLFNGDKKSDKFHQDALTSCSENKDISSS